jgi:hypothetical protein
LLRACGQHRTSGKASSERNGAAASDIHEQESRRCGATTLARIAVSVANFHLIGTLFSRDKLQHHLNGRGVSMSKVGVQIEGVV